MWVRLPLSPLAEYQPKIDQALVAQWIEQRPSKPKVVGSSPARGAYRYKDTQMGVFFYLRFLTDEKFTVELQSNLKSAPVELNGRAAAM